MENDCTQSVPQPLTPRTACPFECGAELRLSAVASIVTYSILAGSDLNSPTSTNNLDRANTFRRGSA